jgi:NADH oxidase (H2O2-forming)
VCGAGVIGLEIAMAFLHMGKDVTVIEMMDQIVPRLIDRDIADNVQRYLEGLGVKFVLKAPVQSVNGTDKVTGVTAANTEYGCEMAIFATGVRANLEIPKQIGLDIGQLGGVTVSPSLQPYKRGRLVPDIYVAGDVIQCESAAMPGPTMNQLGTSAVRQGEIAGKNAAGGKALYGPVASPWVTVLRDMELAGTGLSQSLASWYGTETVSGKAEGLTRSRYYPDAKNIIIKINADAVSHRIIGGQIIAGEGATGKIDWITSMIMSGMTAEDLLVRGENAYCPPTAMVKDTVIMAIEDLCENFKAK